MNSRGHMDKKEYKLVKIKSKLIAKKRINQFFVFVAIVVPIVVMISLLLDLNKLKNYQVILVDCFLILGLFLIYFYGLIKPYEKYQQKLREQKKKEQEIGKEN